MKASTVVAEIREGTGDSALMEKYALSSKGLDSLFRKLVEAGAITQAELDLRTAPQAEEDVEIAWECPACDWSQLQEFDECPKCGVVVSRFKKKVAREGIAVASVAVGNLAAGQRLPDRALGSTFCPSCGKSAPQNTTACPSCKTRPDGPGGPRDGTSGIEPLRKCKECGHHISSRAESCPGCGAVLKPKPGPLNYILTASIVALIGIGGLVFRLGIIESVTNQAAPSSKPVAGLKMPSIGRQIVTYDEYVQIQDGMSYKQVVAIIGSEGEEISRSRMDGIPGVMKSIETLMYQWVNGNGSNMNAMFQNDRLIQKAQFGLR